MKAVHFGAGNIGRGFIGKLLYESGFHTVYADVNEEMVAALNQHESYSVIYASDPEEQFEVRNFSALHSVADQEELVEEIANADLITTAVGPEVLPKISQVVAKGLMKRSEHSAQPLNVIACENAVGGTDLLKQAILEEVPSEQQNVFLTQFGFPNAAVDRIVPKQTQENILDVRVEPFFEWVAEKNKLKGKLHEINGLTLVDNLDAYIERKLYTVNTGHAATAYFGFEKGLNTVKESLDDPAVYQKVRNVLAETGRLLVKKHGFSAGEHEAYIAKTLERFSNPHIVDEVVRVCRMPMKKLHRSERLLNPALQLKEHGDEPEALLQAAAAALAYNSSADEQAVELQKKIQNEGIEATVTEVTELDQNHPFVGSLVEFWKEKQ
ncbi:mannitol-1-phosphate 5-dehydrogenase [Salisediminibacterium halotolerans]|uniref:mannitol-1-phosphate 5-dehydrogenase n=1 Tax=Salisediminibacterium halotolerans TaxID=517425 RepID=UPI000EB33CEF|nr:mannitol-1-phosphate 5-dehydrogenase [Salisediminibacterium halotolerans]RLJ73191.1 mannitol-1-phosphate 5-dehydrogenase [Actinophytocola xinjiangensis]RPE86613.1 mannitol-1-phosphate 5-dehydrogenase [Salisediminibacterium halotolerans]TWG33988.1 D-mannitol 1-phosphate 5-dehydrogenase [Salisediminibacterium halotolerans]GEL06605.1 mannitol-1-phosphate 5-dehydrogenase [Salisediminibacterium halotolerans]